MVKPTDVYEVGDYVYAELGANTDPLWIGKIDEMQSVPEPPFMQIKLKMFYRRCCIVNSVLEIVDKYTDAFISGEDFLWEFADNPAYKSNHVKLHRKLLQRQIFVTQEFIVISPELLRGKCYVCMLTPADSPKDILNKPDTFFFTLAYNAHKHLVCEEQGTIMIGDNYQAEIPPFQPRNKAKSSVEEQVWVPNKCTDDVVNNYLSLIKSIDASKKYLSCQYGESFNVNLVHRDQYKFAALELLHECNYNVDKAVKARVTKDAPNFDEYERWTMDEMEIFEHALVRFQKNFKYIQVEFLPWKTSTEINKFYYQWKGTSRYRSWKEKHGSLKKSVKKFELERKPFRYTWLNKKVEGQQLKCLGCNKQLIVGLLCNPASHSHGVIRWGDEGFVCFPCADHWKRYSGFRCFKSKGHVKSEVDEKKFVPISEIYSGQKLYRCLHDGCTKSFKTRQSLETHYETIHEQSFGRIFCVSASVKAQRLKLSPRTLRKLSRNPFLATMHKNP